MGGDLRADALARPRVRVNQVGYLPGGPKRATVLTDVPVGLAARVRAEDGKVVWSGRTQPRGVDPDSGFGLHLVDFSGLRAGADGPLRVEVDGGEAAAEGDRTLTSHPFRIADDVYRTLLGDALLFFYAQRSGCPIDEDVLPGYGRPAGHVDVPPNRGDRAVRGWTGPDAERLYPGWRLDRPVDVSGGWYDAGDHGKYVVSGALPASMLLDAVERGAPASPGPSRPGRRPGPGTGEEAAWQVDWLLRMQVPDGEQHAGTAFHRVHDTFWTPLPLLPHRDPAPRVLHRPSTAATLHLAAVAAQAAAAARADDPVRAGRLLAAARAAWEAAGREPLLLAPADHGAHGGGPYDDADLDDDRYWAAAELYLATGERRFADALSSSPCHHRDLAGAGPMDWNSLVPYARLRLARGASAAGASAAGASAPGASVVDVARLRADVLAAADRLAAVAAANPWDRPYPADGGWDWGSNGLLLGNLVLLAAAYELADQPRHLHAALAGLDHVFGRNAVGISFVTGYGTDAAHRLRVRHFGHALDPALPPPPPGTVCGGPASKTYPGFPGDPRFAGLPPALCYVDEPTSETTNDACIRWNGPLVWLAAFLDRVGR